LAFALSLLETEKADALVVGGVDEVTGILFHSLDAIGALKPLREMESLNPCQLVSGRGFIPGEGATCLVVQREEHIKERGDFARGKILALSLASAATRQGHYEPDGSTMALAIKAALDEAQLKSEAIDFIGLAANGIKELEDAEARALEIVFGPRWSQIPRIPLRYFVGEFGCAGLLTTATIVLALQEGVLPPYTQSHKLTGIPGDPMRFAPAKKVNLQAGMVIGSTFGGGCGCLVLARKDLR
jgi:3-oxoacyl-(acyl-carrier-protein) synthase